MSERRQRTDLAAVAHDHLWHRPEIGAAPGKRIWKVTALGGASHQGEVLIVFDGDAGLVYRYKIDPAVSVFIHQVLGSN